MAVKNKITKNRQLTARVKTLKSEQNKGRAEREELLRRLRQEYTPSICARTLQVNEDFPISD